VLALAEWKCSGRLFTCRPMAGLRSSCMEHPLVSSWYHSNATSGRPAWSLGLQMKEFSRVRTHWKADNRESSKYMKKGFSKDCKSIKIAREIHNTDAVLAAQAQPYSVLPSSEWLVENVYVWILVFSLQAFKPTYKVRHAKGKGGVWEGVTICNRGEGS